MNGIFLSHLLLFPRVLLHQSSDKQPLTEGNTPVPIYHISISVYTHTYIYIYIHKIDNKRSL